MSSLFSDCDINSEEMNPTSNSSTTLFSISKTTSTNLSKTNSISIQKINYSQNEPINYFLEINTKNSFDFNYSKNFSELENILNKEIQSESNLEFKMINSYLNNLFPKCNQDPFLISQYISKLLYSNQRKKMNKEIETQIDFFIKNKKIKTNTLPLCLNNFVILGYILHSSYNNFKNYNIDNLQKLKNCVNEIYSNGINIINDYDKYCNERKKEKKEYSIPKFISKRKNKYFMPCELIFMMNYLRNINILDINFEELQLDISDFYLYVLVLLNIQIIIPKIDHIKINIINIPFQTDIYSRFFRLQKEALKKTNKYIKSFNISNYRNLFRKKWDFFNVFYINEKQYTPPVQNNSINNNDFESNLMNEDIHINDIINKYTNILSSILITFFSFYEIININKLELIMNDSYSHEYQFFFKKFCMVDVPPFFHILNFIKNKNSINSLNVELNILDFNISKKIFYLIYKNVNLTELQISFFSSDITYLQQSIYKLYYQYVNPKKESKIYYLEDPEIDILNYISKYFEKNLNILFDIILRKKDLTKLGIYFEVPSILINNQKYMILILKFIINIIFLIDEDDSKINTLTLLSPYSVLDKTFFPSIDEYLEDLEILEKNENLLNLNLRLKMYRIVNIKKLISKNLLILNIGDFDLFSFEILINYLISYKFSSISKLKYLTIGLIKSIIDYNKKIQELFNKIFSIKILQLYELNLYTNIIIDSTEKYSNLINILKNRWIASSTIILNDISFKTLENNKDLINNIRYIIPIFKEEIKSDNSKNSSIICYWFLKYLFFQKFKENNYKENFNKTFDKIIYDIFKYLCYERKMTIIHQLNKDSNFDK